MTESMPYPMQHVLISFLIKTYNEEAKIAGCIESVLAAARELPNPFEIIVADSLSSDRTIDVAARYPVTVVQLKHASERGCGAGVQLGYQHARGGLIFILDGDMSLMPGFLFPALRALECNPLLGGVAGLMAEAAVRNAFDEGRIASRAASAARTERWLNGGGLYRREAIVAAGGYAANRNLKGWEEAELGMRLRAAGWQLERIAVRAIVHDGHVSDTWTLMAKHWRTGRLMAHGVLLRAAVGKPWFTDVVRILLHPLCIALMWLVLFMLLAVVDVHARQDVAAVFGGAVAALLSILAVRKKSVKVAVQSFLLWHVHAAAVIQGLFPRTKPVGSLIPSTVVCMSMAY